MKVKFTTNIDKELLKKVKIIGIENGLNVNLIIEDLLNQYIKRESTRVENNKKVVAIFDNGGGIILQLGEYAHYYNSEKQAVADYKTFLDENSTQGWDGNEEELLLVDPDYEEIRNGSYKVYDQSGIEKLVANYEEDQISWSNVNIFIRELVK